MKTYREIVEEFDTLTLVGTENNKVIAVGIIGTELKRCVYNYNHINVAKEVAKKTSFFIGI